MFGKWPTRIFVSAKEKATDANNSEIENKGLKIFILRRSILTMAGRNKQAPKQTELSVYRSGRATRIPLSER